jgi:membrane associated rhomboid family serine protease
MFNNMTPVVKQLLIINILVFILSQTMPQNYETLSLFYFESEKFRFWQPFTHMFMHAKMPNLMHILFNMFALVSFGSALEHFWGGKKFLFFYIACGLGAAFVQTGMNYYEIHQVVNELGLSAQDIQVIFDTPLSDVFNSAGQTTGKVNQILNDVDCTQAEFDRLSLIYGSCVGASGAIYGLLVAFAFMFPMAELMMMFIPVPIKAKFFVPIIVGLDLFSGVTGFSIFSGGGNIAHFAHIGGALTGFLLMMLWRNNKFTHTRWN